MCLCFSLGFSLEVGIFGIILGMDSNMLQTIMSFGTALAGIGACLTAYFTFKALRRMEKRDVPSAVVGRAGDAGVSRNETIVVSNIGFVPFTVVEVCVGGVPIGHDGTEFVADSPRRGIRSVQPGEHALFEIPVGHPNGVATVRIANGMVFRERVDDSRDAD